MLKDQVDCVYVVASKIGSIGMGTTSLHALKGIENSKASYQVFCRGFKSPIKIHPKKLHSYLYLEYLSYPLRFLEKKLGLKINPFKQINKIFGKLVKSNLPKTKTYHTWMGIAPEAILKAKKEGAKLILEGHNSHPLNSIEIMNKEYSKLGMTEYKISPKTLEEESRIINLFDYVLCPSDFVYDSFLKRGFKKSQLIKIPYGVDTSEFTPLKNKNKDSKIKFIFVGSVQIRKGIHHLLQAWEELNLKNAELIICGRVWQDSLEIVSKYKQNKSIKFLSFVNPKEYLQKSDVFVSPSLEEGSALTCYEAMACGIPLITTFNTGSIARDKKDCLIVEAGNVEDLKKKINYFYKNPEKIESMGKSARKFVEDFTWKDYHRRLGEFYKKILK